MGGTGSSLPICYLMVFSSKQACANTAHSDPTQVKGTAHRTPGSVEGAEEGWPTNRARGDFLAGRDTVIHFTLAVYIVHRCFHKTCSALKIMGTYKRQEKKRTLPRVTLFLSSQTCQGKYTIF